MKNKLKLNPWMPGFGIAGFMLLAYYSVFSDFFPNRQDLLGRDHAITLPHLLDGNLWLNGNGFFSFPWFTPSFCAGIPAFADPGNLFYSLPQWLTLFLDPLRSVHMTLYFFAILGLFGFYLLLNRSFLLSSPTAWMGAVLFMFNDYFAYRMVIGQINCHAFMLTPWIAWLLTRSNTSPKSDLPNIAAASLLLAYVVWSGALFLVLPMLIALMIIGLTHGLNHPSPKKIFWTRLGATLLLAAALSAAKWWPGVQLLQHLGPAPTPLAFINGLDNALLLLAASLFFSPMDPKNLVTYAVDPSIPMETYNHAFGVTIIPLVLLFLALGAWVYRRRNSKQRVPLPRHHLTQATAIVILAFIPLSLGTYSALWDPLLRQAPILREGMPLIHSWSVFISCVILWSCLAYDRMPWTRCQRQEQAFAAILCVLAIQFTTHREFLHQENYNPNPILLFYHTEKPPEWTPQIQQITQTIDQQTEMVALPVERNNVMIVGASILFCNHPLFSSLSRFPFDPIKIGPVFNLTHAGFNMKNPACYLAPLENQCKMGDHFQEGQREFLEKFIHYRPFPFRKPYGQDRAEWISLVAFFALFIVLVWTKQGFSRHS
ncbi:MAG: hypothetical protein HW380_3735 [Magnetococcales bacterium]|nr:hypothetical protein [Magnetococcales bacterium]HIJ84782.1 hypothetical protein [Magnetococcales bacterium]